MCSKVTSDHVLIIVSHFPRYHSFSLGDMLLVDDMVESSFKSLVKLSIFFAVYCFVL